KNRRQGIILEGIDLAFHARLRKVRFAYRRSETYVWNSKRLADRKIRGVVFDLDNSLIQSKKGARRALRVVAGIFAKRLRKEGFHYSEANLFRILRLIDLEMHGRKFLYNRDVSWETLLRHLGLSKSKGPWIHKTTLRYWKTYAGTSPLFS